MSRKNIVLLVVVALIIIGVVLWQKKANKAGADGGYSVVYLSTGEVYVGKLSTFPMMELKDGYVLGTAPDAINPEKSNFQLNPLTEALWAPERLYLNKKHVIFYGPILPNSQIAQTLAGQKK